jgi:hypothetical protein
MLNGVATTAVNTMHKIDAIRNLLENTLEKARKELPARIYSKELIELLFEQPYCKIKFLVDSGIAQR